MDSQYFTPESQLADSPYYDIYYQDTQNNEIFTVITDHEYTEFNKNVRGNSLFINHIPVYPLIDPEKKEQPNFGHTEFLITFKSPARNEQIIQTTLQQAIRKINNYLHKLVPLSIELHLVSNKDNKVSRDIPWTIFEDKEHSNVYIPSFLDKPLASVQSIDSLKNDMKFGVQMTFGSEFIDCISVVQNLLAVSDNSIIQAHAVFLNNIVDAVEKNVNNQEKFTPMQIQYIKTFLILIIYRYEAYKKYEIARQTSDQALYKYECYFYIRHYFSDLINVVQIQLGDQFNAHDVILDKYVDLINNEPKYDSVHIYDFLEQKSDYLRTTEIDGYSNRFVLTDNIVLIEFRGFQDELDQFIKSYASPNKHRQIQQDLDECSERITGCYSLDTLNTFAAVNFDTMDRAKNDKKIIMDAPRPSRTARKKPSRFDDA